MNHWFNTSVELELTAEELVAVVEGLRATISTNEKVTEVRKALEQVLLETRAQPCVADAPVVARPRLGKRVWS